MATDLEVRSCFKERFNEMLSDLVLHKDSNSSCMSCTQYSDFLESVKTAKIAKSKSALQYRRLKRFDICVVDGVERLISPVGKGETNMKYFVTNDEIFDILHEIHLAIGHGGKHRMLKEVNKKYKNITQEVIMIYLKLCTACQKKQESSKKGNVVKHIVFSEMNSRCQVDLIDMQSNPDGPYKFIMVYQDHLTKFVQIRPLQSNTAAEVANHLLDIFCIFGAPSILQSDNGLRTVYVKKGVNFIDLCVNFGIPFTGFLFINSKSFSLGREFANGIIKELCLTWHGLKIVHGNPRHSGSVERASQDIQNILMTWMSDERTTKWSEGLRFVQLMKNQADHDEIKVSPYKAMFGSDVKIGLSSSSLPKDVIEVIETEEELEIIIGDVHNHGEAIDEDPNNIKIEIESEDITKNICSFCNKETTLTDGICTSCSRKELNSENPAKKMKQMSVVEFPPCSLGDTLRVKIPDADRGREEFTNVLMSAVKIEGEDLYPLGNDCGTSEQMIPINQFTLGDNKPLNIEEVSSEKQSLQRCHCKAKCATLKCRCKSAGVLCNSKCHSSLSCANK